MPTKVTSGFGSHLILLLLWFMDYRLITGRILISPELIWYPNSDNLRATLKIDTVRNCIIFLQRPPNPIRVPAKFDRHRRNPNMHQRLDFSYLSSLNNSTIPTSVVRKGDNWPSQQKILRPTHRNILLTKHSGYLYVVYNSPSNRTSHPNSSRFGYSHSGNHNINRLSLQGVHFSNFGLLKRDRYLWKLVTLNPEPPIKTVFAPLMGDRKFTWRWSVSEPS